MLEVCFAKLLANKFSGPYDGARVEDLEIIAGVHADQPLGIKAAGGIRKFDDALKAIYAMGVRSRKDISSDRYRIGASASIDIVNGK